MNPNRNQVDIVCHTNLDAFKTEHWPEQLQGIPTIGQAIESAKGRRLRIVSLCWLYDGRLELELSVL